MHTSRISPSTSLAGSWTRPPVIRIAVIAPPRPAAVSAGRPRSVPRSAAAPAARAARRQAGVRCPPPPPRAPRSGSTRRAPSPARSAGSRCTARSPPTPAASRAGTPSMRTATSMSSASVQRLRDGEELRVTAGEIDVAGIAGLPGHRVLRARRPGGARQRQRHHVTLVAERPRELVQRQRAPLPALAPGERGTVDEREMRHVTDAVHQRAQRCVEVAWRRRGGRGAVSTRAG